MTPRGRFFQQAELESNWPFQFIVVAIGVLIASMDAAAVQFQRQRSTVKNFMERKAGVSAVFAPPVRARY